MTKKVKQKIASLLLTTQLFFSLLVPFTPFITPPSARAEDGSQSEAVYTQLQFSSQENGVDNQLHVQVSGSASETMDYSIFYLYEGLTQAIQGELISGSENVIYIGTQSGDDFINHDWQRMIFKVEVDGKVRSYRLENQADSNEVLGGNEVTDDLELSFAESQWLTWTVDDDSKTAVTNQDVVLYQKYVFPLNEKVVVEFTRLPEETSSLTIREVVLSEELSEKYGTDVAFDITTEMENGEFEFDLSLPKSEVTEGDEVEVVYADSEEDLADDEKVGRVETERDGEQLVEVDEEAGVVRARKVEHLTVFVVSGVDNTGSCVGASISAGSGDECYTTIQAAIDNAEAEETIQVSAGTYEESFIVNVKGLTIQGPNNALNGNDSNRTDEAIIKGVVRVEADDVTIEGFFIDGTNIDQTPILAKRGILVANTNARSNVIIKNNVIKNWVTGVSLAGGSVPDWVDGVTIEGNLFINNGIGSTENVNDLTIENNTFDNGGFGLGGGAVLTATPTDNTFTNVTDGRYISAASGVSADFSEMLSRNTFDKAVYANQVTGEWYEKAIFSAIKPAINVAATDSTIEVLSGTYVEDGQIVIDKNLTIIGEDKINTILKPNYSSTGIYSEGAGWFYIKPGISASIKNLTLDGEGQTINAAIQSRGNVVVEDCLIKNIYEKQYFGFGIQLLDGTQNEITNCEFSNIERVGVHVRGGKNGVTEVIATIKDSTFTGRGEGNYLEYGIEFGGGGSGSVDNFTVSNVLGRESGWDSAGILATTLYGEGTSVNVINSTFLNNLIGIIVGYNEEDTTTLNALNNSFLGNTQYGIRAEAAVTAIGEKNWWGDVSGPYHESQNPQGLGGAVSDNVDFCPWLDAEDGESFGYCIDEAKPEMSSISYFKNGLPISTMGTGEDPLYVQNPGQIEYNAEFSDDLKLSHHVFVIYDEHPDNPGRPHWTSQGGKAYCSFNGTNNRHELSGENDEVNNVSLSDCSTDLENGRYVVVNRVYDAVGKFSESYDFTFVVDNTAPLVSDVNLNNKTVPSTDIRSDNCEVIQKFYPVSGEIDFSAIIEDNLSGVDVVRFNIRKVGSNGCTHSSVYRSKNVTMTKGDDGRWSGNFDTTDIPNDGEYTIQLITKDNSGNETIKYVDILVDNTAPEINITPSRQPDVGKWYSTRPSYSNTHPTIELSTNEETTIEYKWNGASDWEVYSSVIDTSVLTNGEHTLYVKATDLAGNPNTAEFTIWLDFSNPEGEMSIEETNGFVSDDMTINFSNVHDPSGSEEISRIEIWIDGHGYQGSAEDLSEGNYRFIFDTTTLIDGVYTARPSIFDKAGNRTRPSVQFTVDNTAPSSTITNPEGDTWHNGPITIEGNTTDENGVTEVLLSAAIYDLDADTCGEYSEITTLISDPAQSDFAWSYDWTPSAEESYCIKAQGTDVAGNPETTAVVQNIIYDITIPEIGVTIDPEDADGSGNWYITRPTLTLAANDNFEVDVIQYQWNSDSETGWKNHEGTQISLDAPSEGTNRLYYRAIDKAENQSEIDETSDTGVYTVHWDATDLTEGPLNVSADPNPTSGSTSTISWDKATDNVGIDHYKVTWDLRDGDDKHSKNVSSDTTEMTITDLEEGTYKVTVTAYDNSGHTKSASTDLVINRTAPAAPTLTLESTGEGTASLSWNEVEDADDYIILYGVESGAYTYAARVGNITEFTVEGLTAGSYYFVVRAVDNVDNQSSNSNEVSTGDILGTAFGTGVGGPAVGFEETGEVLGDETDEEPTQEEMERALAEAAEDGRVKGAAIDCAGWKTSLPWIVLGSQLLLLAAAELLLRHDTSAIKHVIAIGITIAAVASYYLLSNSDCYAVGSINMLANRLFWLVSLILSGLIRFLGYGFIEIVEGKR